MLVGIYIITIEYLKLVLVLCGIMNYKFKKSVAALIVFLITIVLTLIDCIYDDAALISLIVYINMISVALSVSGKKRFLSSFLSFWGISCIDGLIFTVVKMMFQLSDSDTSLGTVLYCVMNSISLILFIVVAILMQKFYYKKRKEKNIIVSNVKSLYMILLAVGLLTATFYMAPFVIEGFADSDNIRRMIGVSVAITGILFLIIGVLLLYNYSSKQHYKNIAEMNDRLLQMQKNYYQVLLDKEVETRRFRHDISNHIICIDELMKNGKYEQVTEYLSDLRNMSAELTNKYSTGNMLVNAILNDIAGRYGKVELNWQGLIPNEMKLSDTDICTIFSNTLDNAFCAASACEKDGFVKVKIINESGKTIVTIENNMKNDIKEVDGKFHTSKKDKDNHGFGVMNVKRCVEKCNGLIDIEYTKDIFRVKIVLSNV